MHISVLGGTLVRRGRNEWVWSDGTPEPRVRDLSASTYWNFRCRTDGTGRTYVEIPLALAMEESALEWALLGFRVGRYQFGCSLDHTGPLVMTDEGLRRSHIEPGTDPLCGNEPLPELPGPIPRVILVPIEEWDRWAEDYPLGAEWDKEDQAAILEKARSLGWGTS